MNKRLRHLLVLLATGVTVLAGCGSQRGTEPGSGGDAGRPADGTYVATTATVDGADRPLVPGSRITFTIKGSHISLNSGCNLMSGDGSWDGTTLTIGSLAMTEMACEEPLMTQDSWLAGLFDGPVDVALRGDGFTLTSGTTVLDFAPGPLPEPTALLGTHWTLDAITQSGGEDAVVSSIPEGVLATLFLKDGEAEVSTGCNQGSGSFQREGDRLFFEELRLSKRPCNASNGPVESAVLSMLSEESVAWSIEGETLTLTGPDGRSLTYRADHGLDPEPVPDTIEGQTWRLTTIADIDGDSTGMAIVPDQVTATLTVTDGTGLLTTGCNAGGANITVRGTQVQVGSIRMTKMACRGAAGAIEAQVLRILRQGDLTWSITDGELRLTSSHGDHQLVYHATDGSE